MRIRGNNITGTSIKTCGLAFAYLWPRSRIMAVVTVIIAAAIASARVLAHLHWPIDVATGFVLGFPAALATRGALALVRARKGPDATASTVPPVQIPLAFVATALATLAATLVWTIVAFPAPLALLHALVVGVFLTIAMGLLYQFVPVVAMAPLRLPYLAN
jgi:hypothetical protein